MSVSQVGHAGTLDPMATGLLIVCVGKATKVVDRFVIPWSKVYAYDDLQKENIKVICICRYQGMIKGYSGVFRLGEATSTLDADSPVLQQPLSLILWFISTLDDSSEFA